MKKILLKGIFISYLFIVFLFTAGCNSKVMPITKDGKHYIEIEIDSTIGFSPELEKSIEPYRKQIEVKMNKVIGYSDADLLKGRPESYLTNFIADLILDEGRTIAKEQKLPIPQISIINTKGLRSPIRKGPVTVGSVFRLMPFENKLVILELNGKDMRKLFDHMAGFGGESISGASYGIENNKAVSIKINGKPFNPSNTYTVIVPDYIANGGDRYYMLENTKSRFDTGILIRDVIIQGIENITRQNEHLTSTLDKRVYHVN